MSSASPPAAKTLGKTETNCEAGIAGVTDTAIVGLLQTKKGVILTSDAARVGRPENLLTEELPRRYFLGNGAW